MLKFHGGDVTNPKTGDTKDIIIKAKVSNNPRNLLIGLGITAVGIVYLMVTSFKDGAEAYLNAENKALVDAGIMDDIERCYVKFMKH